MPKRAFPGASTFVFDFIAGLVGFLALATWLGAPCIEMSAYANELPWPPQFFVFDAPLPFELMASPPPSRYLPDVLSLAVAFATTLALNLWFARHIARTYAKARRRETHSRRG